MRPAGLALAEATFARGRAIARATDDPELVAALAKVERPIRPFAWEGAGLELALAARTVETDDEDRAFVDVGTGFASALTGRTPPDRPWCHDGWGFGFTTVRRRSLEDGTVPREAGPWFDHGVGRALWFASGDPRRTAALVGALRAERQEMLWRGVGLASAFSGGFSAELERAAGTRRDALELGVAQGRALRRSFGAL